MQTLISWRYKNDSCSAPDSRFLNKILLSRSETSKELHLSQRGIRNWGTGSFAQGGMPSGNVCMFGLSSESGSGFEGDSFMATRSERKGRERFSQTSRRSPRLVCSGLEYLSTSVHSYPCSNRRQKVVF